MHQPTLTQMWDESFEDDISTLNSENESSIEDEAVFPIDGNDNVNSDNSQVTVPFVYDDSSAIDGISFESTQINVPAQLLTQDFHNSNDENAVNVTLSSDANDEEVTEEEVTEEEVTEEDVTEEEVTEEDVTEEDVTEEVIAENEYHYFLQTHLGLYHDNLAHQEQVEYLVWVLENYDEFLLQNN